MLAADLRLKLGSRTIEIVRRAGAFYFTFRLTAFEVSESDPVAGGVAVNTPVNVMLYVPLVEFFAETERKTCGPPFTAT
jgi:hypothetical protein